ncbi:hypothetical protein [Olivibacter domesticus]|uniref:Uncharacterized protein n=1 Tax=Olivibacter domesticus TaxID=407022 RepID=A0A1H7W2X9_OLID1|nr:hypothetical protein [Olivibacter domesticus]SEM15821.1 hypothetical protein SAMN05661044_04395 [Olivibacter domesticus]
MKRKKVEFEKKKGKLVNQNKSGSETPGNLADEDIATDHASIDELEEDITGPVKKNVPPKPDLLRGDHPDLAK